MVQMAFGQRQKRFGAIKSNKIHPLIIIITPHPLIESHMQEIDNTPDMDAAVDLEDNVGGKSQDAWINKCFDE